MPALLKRRTALLLIALMAILPLHGLLAATTHQQGDGHSPVQHQGHMMLDSSGMQACEMPDAAAGQGPHDGHHCDGSGCDLCGACSADLPRGMPLSLDHERYLPESQHPAGRPVSRLTPLYRPPRA